jgi:hypothetical protein
MSSLAAPSAASLTDRDWTQLMKRLRSGQCTPFLGAGVNDGLLPTGGEIANKWAVDNNYPLSNAIDLPRVAQYLALTGPERVYPKSLIQELFDERIRKYSRAPEFPLPRVVRGLAGLPIPLFLTTNYDDFLFRALRAVPKQCDVEICCWNESLRNSVSVKYRGNANAEPVFGASHFSSPEYEPTVERPLIYHVHGHYQSLDSMVLTENDYLDFLVQLSRDSLRIPPRIQEALTRSSLVFLGYSLTDYNFRVLFRGLVQSFPETRRLSVSIQLEPTQVPEPARPAAMDFLNKYFNDISIKVYWGSAEAFTAELADRWKAFSAGNENG